LKFHFRVRIRKTAASFLPSFQIGSQQSVKVQEGAEMAADALEMPEVERNRSSAKSNCDNYQSIQHEQVYESFSCTHIAYNLVHFAVIFTRFD